jgi:hypothetical protein
VPPAALIERAKRVGDAIAADTVSVARFDIGQLANETERFLDQMARDVRECKNVFCVSLFVRWLQFSGCLGIIALHSETTSKNIHKKFRDLIFECGEMQRGGKIELKYSSSDIAEINRKLDVLTSALARKVSPPDTATEDVVTAPAPLLVLPQGES